MLLAFEEFWKGFKTIAKQREDVMNLLNQENATLEVNKTKKKKFKKRYSKVIQRRSLGDIPYQERRRLFRNSMNNNMFEQIKKGLHKTKINKKREEFRRKQLGLGRVIGSNEFLRNKDKYKFKNNIKPKSIAEGKETDNTDTDGKSDDYDIKSNDNLLSVPVSHSDIIRSHSADHIDELLKNTQNEYTSDTNSSFSDDVSLDSNSDSESFTDDIYFKGFDIPSKVHTSTHETSKTINHDTIGDLKIIPNKSPKLISIHSQPTPLITVQESPILDNSVSTMTPDPYDAIAKIDKNNANNTNNDDNKESTDTLGDIPTKIETRKFKFGNKNVALNTTQKRLSKPNVVIKPALKDRTKKNTTNYNKHNSSTNDSSNDIKKSKSASKNVSNLKITVNDTKSKKPKTNKSTPTKAGKIKSSISAPVKNGRNSPSKSDRNTPTKSKRNSVKNGNKKHKRKKTYIRAREYKRPPKKEIKYRDKKKPKPINVRKNKNKKRNNDPRKIRSPPTKMNVKLKVKKKKKQRNSMVVTLKNPSKHKKKNSNNHAKTVSKKRKSKSQSPTTDMIDRRLKFGMRNIALNKTKRVLLPKKSKTKRESIKNGGNSPAKKRQSMKKRKSIKQNKKRASIKVKNKSKSPVKKRKSIKKRNSQSIKTNGNHNDIPTDSTIDTINNDTINDITNDTANDTANDTGTESKNNTPITHTNDTTKTNVSSTDSSQNDSQSDVPNNKNNKKRPSKTSKKSKKNNDNISQKKSNGNKISNDNSNSNVYYKNGKKRRKNNKQKKTENKSALKAVYKDELSKKFDKIKRKKLKKIK